MNNSVMFHFHATPISPIESEKRSKIYRENGMASCSSTSVYRIRVWKKMILYWNSIWASPQVSKRGARVKRMINHPKGGFESRKCFGTSRGSRRRYMNTFPCPFFWSRCRFFMGFKLFFESEMWATVLCYFLSLKMTQLYYFSQLGVYFNKEKVESWLKLVFRVSVS